MISSFWSISTLTLDLQAATCALVGIWHFWKANLSSRSPRVELSSPCSRGKLVVEQPCTKLLAPSCCLLVVLLASVEMLGIDAKNQANTKWQMKMWHNHREQNWQSLFSESFSDEETMLFFMKYTLSWHYAQYSGLVRHPEHLVGWLGRQSRTAQRADNNLETEQRTFLSKFLGEFNSSFCEIHISIAIHAPFIPGGVERTFFITISEANGARREAPLWARL